MEKAETKNRKGWHIRTHTVATIAILLALVVSLGLSWQLYEYRGLMAFLAEWQFAHLNKFFPLATIALIVLLIEIPLIIVLIARSGSSRTAQLLIEEPTALLVRSKLAYRELLFVAAAIGVCAVALWFYGNSIGMTTTAKPVDITQSNGPVASGTHVQVSGTLRLDRIALYKSNSLFFNRSLKVAPVQTAPNQPIRFLVEVDARQPELARSAKLTGLAASAAVAGPLVSLYRDAGFKMSKRPTLIVTSLDTVRMPFTRTGTTLAIIALLVFAVGMAERYWYKSLNRQYLDWKDAPKDRQGPRRREWWSAWGWNN